MKPLYPGIALALAALSASADDLRVPEHPAYAAECGSCHVAYPPQLLSAASWRQTMAGLDKHFGSDASLEPALAREIGQYLADYAGGKRAGNELRITETRWFRKEHRNEIPAGKNPADCAACHRGAEKGIYED
jgi:hypothetical protein